MSSGSPPIRIGLIGYGFVSKTFHAPMIRATSGFQLVAVASSDPNKVHADLGPVEVFADPQVLAMQADVDLVVIASPNETHRPLAEAALAAGRHVLVDKPFVLTLADARAVLSAAKAADRLACVFQNRRWDSDFLGVRHVVEQGLVGSVMHFESRIDRYRPVVRDRWREAAVPGGGLWFDLGPHLVDQALQLFGLPDRVRADFAQQRSGARVEDWVHVVLDYGAGGCGRRVVLHSSMLVAGGSSRFVVHGTAGSLIKRKPDIQEDQLRAGILPSDPDWGVDPDAMLFFDESGEERTITTPPGDQCQLYVQLREAIRGRGPNPTPPHEVLGVMAVLEGVAESARSGQAQALALSAAERGPWA